MEVPEKVLSNHDLGKIVDTNDEWISSRTGIRERHIVSANETSSTMGTRAAAIAIENAGISKDLIDMVIFASMTPDYVFPASACLIQDNLKLSNTGTIDIEAACSGFVYGLSMANAYVVSGMAKNVLVVGADAMSRILDWTDRNTCVLFGDGAGAAVVSANTEDDSGFLGFKLWGDGKYKDFLYMQSGGSASPATEETVGNKEHFLKMMGNSTFKVAVKTMADELEELLTMHHVQRDQVKILIPHQANYRIIKSVADRLKFPMEKVFVNLDRYGNTSAATIPIALTEAFREGWIEKGDIVAFVAFGGGFTSGAALLKW
jgi:3-oxoacyl-[acyl-carrier-protein] synthase-3